ncbi:MAG: hypothetical protein GY707_11545 [Desulfobacteraceae bacterium]|nr:hypothetical protein [Desulfobacteraceae bacterium]
MTKKNQVSGLCVNCLNVEHCSYHVNHIKPIIFCEEFFCTEPSESRNTAFKTIKKGDSQIISTVNGLCFNCENVETCKLQKAADAISHCEEYR